jgi:hypothetical protein
MICPYQRTVRNPSCMHCGLLEHYWTRVPNCPAQEELVSQQLDGIPLRLRETLKATDAPVPLNR